MPMLVLKQRSLGAFSYGRQDGLIAKAVNDYTDVLPGGAVMKPGQGD